MTQIRDLADFSITYSQANTGIISKGTSGATSTPNTVYAPASAYDVANSAYIALQSVQTTNFTAVAGRSYPVNTSNGAITVTLPASPTPGQQINIFDYAGTASSNNIIINPNGNKIEALVVFNWNIRTNRQSTTIVYIDSTQGWVPITSTSSTALYYTIPIQYLVVGGGAGTGANYQGGGGGGGVLTSSLSGFSGMVFSAVVGGGGSGAGINAAGTNGGNSTLTSSTTITAYGGGTGAVYNINPRSGGCGGGGESYQGGSQQYGAAGTSGQGYAGGDAIVGSYAGGGGGAGSIGSAPNGGNGLASSITGSSDYYGGGGGGDGNAGTGGNGGSGGGGNAYKSGISFAQSGTANKGGGGGAGGNGSGGSGGSGVVILSVPTQFYSNTTTGSPTVTTSGSNTIIKFTSSGSYTA